MGGPLWFPLSAAEATFVAARQKSVSPVPASAWNQWEKNGEKYDFSGGKTSWNNILFLFQVKHGNTYVNMRLGKHDHVFHDCFQGIQT